MGVEQTGVDAAKRVLENCGRRLGVHFGFINGEARYTKWGWAFATPGAGSNVVWYQR